jgi:hypothetical protein
MAKFGVPDEHYHAYMQNGGLLTFRISSVEIDPSMSFEFQADLKDKLDTGFELPPSFTAVGGGMQCGEGWGRVASATYSRGGHITYKRVAPGLYVAIAQMPMRRDN